MELTYTCEKSEKETLELAMRPFRIYFRTMFGIAAVMFVVGSVYAVADLIGEGLVAQNGVNLGKFCLFMGVFLLFFGWGLRRRLRRGVVDTYRKRKTNLVEYRLFDNGLSCAYGETRATMPWSEFAKFEEFKESGHFRDFYPESERDKWLEKVRPLVQELREDMADGE